MSIRKIDNPDLFRSNIKQKLNDILKDEKKIRFGVSLDPNIYKRMIKEKINKSRLIEKLLKQHYGD